MTDAQKASLNKKEKDVLMGRVKNDLFKVGNIGSSTSGPLHVFSTVIVSLTFTLAFVYTDLLFELL